MNLFVETLKRTLQSSEDFEARMEKMQADILRYRQLEKSPEVAEYFELKKIVESAAFQEKKNRLLHRTYKQTEEGQKTARYEELKRSSHIRMYMKAVESDEFQRFLRFRESEEYGKIRDPKELKQSAELRRYAKIDRSRLYQNYLRVATSRDLKQLQALEEELATTDFKERDAFWRDPKRWQLTEEAQQEARYKELAASDDIRFFLSMKVEDIEKAEMYRPVWADDMQNLKNWKPGFGFDAPLRDGYSFANERQAYNRGKNTVAAVGRLDIETRLEPTTTVAWDEKKGFVEKTFEYSSDVVNTKEAFKIREGLIMAKVRSQGNGVHALYLSQGKQRPIISLYYYNGNTHSVGIVTDRGYKQVPITGVLRSKYHVYSLRITKQEIIWYVNNLELLRIKNPLKGEEMFFVAQSSLPQNVRAGEGKLKIAWIKAFEF
mgnify:CR=1 FL=1